MTMKKYKPTSPSRRQMSTVDYSGITTKKPLKALVKQLKKTGARNNQGRITMRHQGGGHKRLYRMVDFKQERFDIPAIVEEMEYDPNRTAFIARILYKDGLRSYVLAPIGIKVGSKIITAEKTPVKIGNRMSLKNIPIGYHVHNIELQRGAGGRLARSAGSSAQVLAHSDGYTDLKLSSREVRKVSWNGLATIGQVSNSDQRLVNIGKAGRSRWLGIRPTVRGSAMNPCDHPYGGGEGRQPRGTKRPKDKWGNVTGGRKTRKKNKWSNKLIIKRRTTKRK
ncbi:MAG: 50S ribosomal protein L2 [Patescibacteria group bacterium]